MPLDGYLKLDGDLSDISAPVIQSLTYEGQIYAAPLNDAVVAMFYNKKLFAKAGIMPPSKNPDEAWTIDQYIAAAEKINDPANKIVGIDPAWGFGTGEGSAYVKMPLLWQAGGEILSPDGSTSKGYLDSPIMKKVLQRFSSLYNDKKIAVKELPADAFFNGTLGIKVDGPWSISYNHDKFPNFKIGEDWDVAPYWKDEKQIVANGSWNLAITKDSKHAQEAWMFINWVTGKEGAKVWYKATANIPARNSTAESFPELQSYPLNIFLAESAKYAKPRPVSPAYPAISLAYTKIFEDVGIANRNIDESIKDAVDQIEKALAKTKK
jgi:fructooligosaccharide transport system substrate-binding protein